MRDGTAPRGRAGAGGRCSYAARVFAGQAAIAALRPGLGVGLAGLVVAVAAVTVALPITATESGRVAVAGAVLVALTAAAGGVRSAPAVRALVFLDVVFAVLAAGSFGGWPPALTTVLVCVLPVAALLVCGRTGWLHPAAPWLLRGRLAPQTLAFGAGTVVLAGVALALWAVTVRPEPAPYLRALQELPTWVGVAGVAGFAVVNPLWEEALFRGVLLEELTGTWGVRAALVVQALVFGAAHWAGFPSGWMGMGMAAAWGLALGIIRVHSGGILLPYLVHVCANAVIGVLALALLR